MTAPAAVDLQKLIDDVGFSLPIRQRIQGSKRVSAKLVPTGELVASAVVDSFANGKNSPTMNSLADKQHIVLLIGKGSTHQLTRTFLAPKMALIYHHLTLKRPDIEFLYVSLDDDKAKMTQFAQTLPWPSVPFDDHATRSQLVKTLHQPLKKMHGAASIVVLQRTTTSMRIETRDAEPFITRTHKDKGEDFPWQVSGGENCCAVGAALSMCNIM